MAGSLPPSSSVSRLRSSAAAAATFFPVAMEPVKLILRASGCEDIAGPSASPPLMTLNTPGGSRSRTSSPNLSVASGVYGDGLSTTVLPARRAAATFATAMKMGKFHGTIVATGPMGACTSSTRAVSSSRST
jgi:hypothetical protein